MRFLRSSVKSYVIFTLTLLCFTLCFSPAALSQNQSDLEKADQSYDSGDCKQALKFYGAAKSETAADASVGQKILFRQSYCHLNLGDYAEAESGFARFLVADPKNDEAKTKHADALLNLGRHQEAQAQADQVLPGDFKTEASVISARSSIELGDAKAALHTLNSVREPGTWFGVVTYWKGVALYHNQDLKGALKTFKLAKGKAESGSWVIADSQSWIDSIEFESRLFRGYLTAGYLSDSSISQSSTNLLNTSPGGVGAQGGGPGGAGGAQGPGGPGTGGPGAGPAPGGQPGNNGGAQQGPPTTASSGASIGATGLWVSGGLTMMPYYRGTQNISTSVSYSSPYYSNSSLASYQYQTIEGDVSANFATSTSATADWWGLKLEYMTANYNAVHYMDFLIANPYYAWTISSNWYLRFDLAANQYIDLTSTNTLTPSASLRWVLTPNFALKTGASYTAGTGQQAVYANSSPPVVASGAIFSNYNTTGGFFGLWWKLPLEIEFSGQIGNYVTSYNKENLVTNGQTPPNRSDNLTQVVFDFSYPIIRNYWNLDFSTTIANNASSGMQGLATSSGTSTAYSYNRNYYLLTTTFSF